MAAGWGTPQSFAQYAHQVWRGQGYYVSPKKCFRDSKMCPTSFRFTFRMMFDGYSISKKMSKISIQVSSDAASTMGPKDFLKTHVYIYIYIAYNIRSLQMCRVCISCEVIDWIFWVSSRACFTGHLQKRDRAHAKEIPEVKGQCSVWLLHEGKDEVRIEVETVTSLPLKSTSLATTFLERSSFWTPLVISVSMS